MTLPSAKIILDSISEQGQRLTTMEVVMHRFVLAEFNTHRAFSRNSASSRAIPYVKIRNRVVDDIAFPVHLGGEQKGMQSGDEIDDPAKIQLIKSLWYGARNQSVEYADLINELGLHKSLVNRLLEPFMWHTAIVSATNWDNFFHQRCSPLAQPEIKVLADAMQRAYYTSTPKVLTHGEWHLPYIDQVDRDKVETKMRLLSHLEQVKTLREISTARCARVSYLTHDGKRDIALDLELFSKLRDSGHWSPFEHVATPVGDYLHSGSNFIGWKQFRKEFQDENFTNFVPNLPELAHVVMKMEYDAEQLRKSENEPPF